MLPTPKITVLLAGVLIAVLPLLASTNAKKSAMSKGQAQQEEAPAAIPQPPPTPEQMPASPPRVTMNGGELSITAENSTLGDILSAVKSLTGAGVELPNMASSERVAVRLGPGKPQDVLQQLLAGSKFDYIILGSPENPASIQKIILTPRSPGGATSGSINNAASQPPRGGYEPPPEPDYQADSGGVDDQIVEPEPPPGPQNEVNPPPEEGAQQQMIGPGGEAQQQQPQPGPKTPEQLLQELQRMQQQQNSGQPPRQQMQQ